MPPGTPYTMKCPKCRRGKYGYPRKDLGTRKTGVVELRITRSQHKGTGNGGSSFFGHRGQVECLDCGHKWFSTHPDSGRIKCWRDTCEHT